MATIVFSLDPPFRVDLTPRQTAAHFSLCDVAARVGKAAAFPFYSTAIFFQSLAYAAASTGKSIPTLYKNASIQTDKIMDNLRAQESVAYLYPKVLVALGFTILDCALLFVVDAARRVYGKLFPQSGLPHSEIALKHLKQNKLHPEHMQVIDTAVDIRHVPDTVQVSNLLQFYEDNTSSQAGYVLHTTNRKDLEKLIHNIKNRVPFLGTPPSYDIPQLERFYKAIEDNLRFCIHKVAKDLEKFQESAGTEPSKYTEDQKNQYKNYKEEIHRLAVDMAGAGARCGAAYCAESLDAYSRLSGKKTPSTMTLQEYLHFLCTEKRREIAQKHIAKIGTDVHCYTQYMEALGKILALPSSQNVIEHLTSLKNPIQQIEQFFQEYTDQEIIRTVQEEIKKSDTLRERIFDWAKEQHTQWNWKQEEIQTKLTDIVEQINPTYENSQEAWDKCNKFDVVTEKAKLEQVYKNRPALEKLLLSTMMQQHALDFVEQTKLYPSELAANGLPKEYMEWLLVSHKILQPQIDRA